MPVGFRLVGVANLAKRGFGEFASHQLHHVGLLLIIEPAGQRQRRRAGKISRYRELPLKMFYHLLHGLCIALLGVGIDCKHHASGRTDNSINFAKRHFKPCTEFGPLLGGCGLFFLRNLNSHAKNIGQIPAIVSFSGRKGFAVGTIGFIPRQR